MSKPQRCVLGALKISKVAKVAGEYSAILESSCGTYVVASGSTLYELIGVEDLQTREMEVIAMSTSACDDTSSTSDCYR